MMKNVKVAVLAAAICFAGTASAQSEYRMLVKKNSETTGYRVDRVQEVSFVEVKGEVKAEVSVSDVQLEQLTVTVQRSAACKGFRIAVCPRTLTTSYWNYPEQFTSYIEQNGSSILTEDFIDGKLSGIALESGSDYSCVTVGYDEYGVACDLCRADFSTPKANLLGNPKVTSTVKKVGLYDFTIHCVPNEDVKGYACVAGEAGTMQAQYDMYAAMFGFTNFGEMIRGWGIEEHNEKDISWNDMNPGTDYEIFVQPWDFNDNYADCDVVALRTETLGGTGEATVSITLGDYKLQTWGEEQLPSQFITFTPNDQAACYRYQVCLADGAEGYDALKDDYQNELKQDPPYDNMAYWFFYEPLTTDFQINPNTNCVAIASAKNADGVWGPVTEVRFTTPSSAAKSAYNGIQTRKVHQQKKFRMNQIPVLQQSKITLK